VAPGPTHAIAQYSARSFDLSPRCRSPAALSMLGFGAIAVVPTLAAVASFQVLRRAGNYALSQPARQVLYTVVSREDRYKAKNFIDTAVYRAGDQVGAWSYALVGFIGWGSRKPALSLLCFRRYGSPTASGSANDRKRWPNSRRMPSGTMLRRQRRRDRIRRASLAGRGRLCSFTSMRSERGKPKSPEAHQPQSYTMFSTGFP
jgi:hypothetical protein